MPVHPQIVKELSYCKRYFKIFKILKKMGAAANGFGSRNENNQLTKRKIYGGRWGEVAGRSFLVELNAGVEGEPMMGGAP